MVADVTGFGGRRAGARVRGGRRAAAARRDGARTGRAGRRCAWCAAVGLPFGAEGAGAIAAACAQAVGDGADVLDVVVSLPLLANGDFPAARDELAAAVAAANAAAPGGPARRRARGDRDLLPGAARPGGWPRGWWQAAGCDGVVCATGLGPEGATPAAIEALRAELPPERRRQGAGRHPVARRRAARARRGCGSARRRRSGGPAGRVRGGRQRPAAPSGRTAAQSRAVSGH